MVFRCFRLYSVVFRGFPWFIVVSQGVGASGRPCGLICVGSRKPHWPRPDRSGPVGGNWAILLASGLRVWNVFPWFPLFSIVFRCFPESEVPIHPDDNSFPRLGPSADTQLEIRSYAHEGHSSFSVDFPKPEVPDIPDYDLWPSDDAQLQRDICKPREIISVFVPLVIPSPKCLVFLFSHRFVRSLIFPTENILFQDIENFRFTCLHKDL